MQIGEPRCQGSLCIIQVVLSHDELSAESKVGWQQVLFCLRARIANSFDRTLDYDQKSSRWCKIWPPTSKLNAWKCGLRENQIDYLMMRAAVCSRRVRLGSMRKMHSAFEHGLRARESVMNEKTLYSLQEKYTRQILWDFLKAPKDSPRRARSIDTFCERAILLTLTMSRYTMTNWGNKVCLN